MFKKYALCFSTLGLAVLSLTGCHSVSGNVIPQSGPSMESVYDSMGVADDQKAATAIDTTQEKSTNDSTEKTAAENNLDTIREQAALNTPYQKSAAADISSSNTVFHKLPNPELKLYVYPHLAGSDEIPIPGYYTALNVYDKTYYALPSETPN